MCSSLCCILVILSIEYSAKMHYVRRPKATITTATTMPNDNNNKHCNGNKNTPTETTPKKIRPKCHRWKKRSASSKRRAN